MMFLHHKNNIGLIQIQIKNDRLTHKLHDERTYPLLPPITTTKKPTTQG